MGDAGTRLPTTHARSASHGAEAPPAPAVIPLVDEAVFEDRPQGREAVDEADLLALFVGATAVGDRHLVDPVAPLRDLRGDLGLEVEAVRTDLDLREHLAP